MSVAALREAFNAVAEPAYSCQQATLHYEWAHDVQWQILTFHGTSGGGQAFTVLSVPLRPETDVMLAARDTAQKLLKTGIPPP